jgi:hypothetical protein
VLASFYSILHGACVVMDIARVDHVVHVLC